MALPRRVLLGFALLFGPSGCLLDTGPINSPPQVRIVANSEPIYRNRTVPFSAYVKDEDSPASLRIKWAVFQPQNNSCTSIGRADWAGVAPQTAEAPYPFAAPSLAPVCLCAQVIDHFGATGQDCLKIQAENRDPTATITDTSGAASEDLRPLYSRIHLYAETSDPDGDPLQYLWQLQFAGSDPDGKSTALAPCAGVAAADVDLHRCFTANVPGIYTVTLQVTDNAGGDATANFTIPVNVDTPPCIQRTDPDVRAQRIVLSRSTDLGAAYESRRFQVLNVADDSEPFPVSATGTQIPPKFYWFVYDPQSPSPTWVRSTNDSPVFTLSQSMFPNALPGDTVRLRLEVRDSVVAATYTGWPCQGDPDICCAPNVCGGANECIRWTTWTVQFQP